MRNMHIKRSRNFVYPTEKGSEWHKKSEAAFRELQASKKKPNIEVFTNRRSVSIEDIHRERIQRRMAVAS
jgi:hypothetical protein